MQLNYHFYSLVTVLFSLTAVQCENNDATIGTLAALTGVVGFAIIATTWGTVELIRLRKAVNINNKATVGTTINNAPKPATGNTPAAANNDATIINSKTVTPLQVGQLSDETWTKISQYWEGMAQAREQQLQIRLKLYEPGPLKDLIKLYESKKVDAVRNANILRQDPKWAIEADDYYTKYLKEQALRKVTEMETMTQKDWDSKTPEEQADWKQVVKNLAYECDEYYFVSEQTRAKSQNDNLKSKPKTAVATSYGKLLSEHVTLMERPLTISNNYEKLHQAYRPIAKADQQLIEEMAGLDFDKWSTMSASARETFFDKLIEFGNRAKTEEDAAYEKVVQENERLIKEESGVTQGEKQTPLENEKVSTTLVPHPSEQEPTMKPNSELPAVRTRILPV